MKDLGFQSLAYVIISDPIAEFQGALGAFTTFTLLL